MKMKKSELKQIIREEIKRMQQLADTAKENGISEGSNLDVKISSINGKRFYFSKGAYTSPSTDGAGFIQQLRDLQATAPDGYASAEMWVHDKETRQTPGASANVKVNPAKFASYFK